MRSLTKIPDYLDKTAAVIKDVLSFEGEKAIIVFAEKEKEILEKALKNQNIYTFNQFIYHLLKENMPGVNPISNVQAIAILNKICKGIFKESSLRNLADAKDFLYQLLDLTSRLEASGISVSKFREVLVETKIGEIDKKRLTGIADVIEEFKKTLAQNSLSFSDNHLQLILKNPKIFENIEFKNFFIISNGRLNLSEVSFIKELSLSRNVFLYGSFAGIDENTDKISSIEPAFEGELTQRAKYIFTGEKAELKKSDKINYCSFENENEEFEFISDYILEKTKRGTADFSDIAVLAGNFERKQAISNYLSVREIPTDFIGANAAQRNFMYTFERYLDICAVIKNAGLQKFSLSEIAKINSLSKAMAQYHTEQLNLYFENLIAEIFEDVYLKDRLLADADENCCVLTAVERKIDTLKDTDKKKFYELTELFAALYKAYSEQRFSAFAKILYENFIDKYDDTNDKNLLSGFYKRFENQAEALQKLLEGGLVEELNPKLFLEICRKIWEKSDETSKGVRILSYREALSGNYEHVILSYFDESLLTKKGRFIYFVTPLTNEKISDGLRKFAPDFGKLIEDDFDIQSAKDVLAYIFMNTKGSVLLTNSVKDGSTSCYEKLVREDSANFLRKESQLLSEEENQTAVNVEEKTGGFVLPQGEKLALSASSISSFQKCPRKFFYKHLLCLKEASTFSANYGTIVHSVLEVFGNNYLSEYTKKKLTELVELLFDSGKEPQKALEAGFSERNIDLIAKASPLSLYEMRRNFLDALEEMEKGGFFERIPTSVCTEKGFNFEPETFSDVVLDGRIDAIEEINGSSRIVDYKTGGDIVRNLGAMFEEDALDFDENPKKANQYNYQLPIYLLACEEAPQLKEFSGKVGEIGYEYIRPKDKEGFKEDFVPYSQIMAVKEQILNNLQKTIIDKMREVKTFSAVYSSYNCAECAYGYTCDAVSDEEEDE